MKIFKVVLFFVIFCTCFSFLCSSDIYNKDNYFYKTSLYINSDFEVNYLINRLNDGWRVYSRNIGKNYINDMTSSTNTKKYTSIFGIFSMEAYLKLNDKIKAMADFDVYTAENKSFWHPITDQNRKTYGNKEFVSLKKVEINFQDYYYHVRLFKGIGHYHWKYEGDMFDFYQEQFDTERYLNISSRTIPEGVEIDYSFDYLGDLKVIYGEPVWGQDKSLYVKYNRKVGAFSNYILYKHEKTLWDVEDKDDEYQESYAFSTNLENIFSFNLSLGVMYHPFRLHRIYEYEKNKEKEIGFTEKKDAFGYAIRLYGRDFVPIFDYTTLEGKYLGILAGNKQETSLSFDKILKRFFLNFKALYRKPLEKANPLIFYKNTEALCLHPRGEDSPFLVNDSNREMYSGDINLTYFYDSFNPNFIFLYEMGNLTSWNLNKKDNTLFSASFNFNVKKYKGNTDLSYYTNEDDRIIWESDYLPGVLESKYPLKTYSLFLKGRFKQGFNYNLLCNYGDSFATGSNAYVDNQFVGITQFLDIDFNLYINNFVVLLKYAKDCWGYEDWHRFFGITYDNLYRYEIGKDFGIFGELGLSYLRVVQNKYKTEIIDIPSFEEVMLKWKYNFNRIYKFREKDKNLDLCLEKQTNNKDSILVTDRNSGFLTLNNDMINDKIIFDLNVSENLKIVSCYVEILDASKHKIFKKEFRGNLPKFFEWDGTLTQEDFSLENGKYEIVFCCLLDNGNFLYSDKHPFYVYSYPSIMDSLSLRTIVNNSDVVLISEKYKEFIFKYDLDDIYNKNDLRTKTLDVLLPVLTKSEVKKIKIFVYSNYENSLFADQNRSNVISKSILNYFLNNGVSLDIIETKGFSLRDKKVSKFYRDNTLIISCIYDSSIISEPFFSKKFKTYNDDDKEKIKEDIEKGNSVDSGQLDVLKSFAEDKEIKLFTDVLFRFGKFNLTKFGIKSLRKIADDLKKYSFDEYDILLEGYTCNIGKSKYNKRLSLKRAISVSDVFKKVYGLKHRILVVGRGEDNPLFPNINEANRKKNRRIEISIIKK